MLKRPSWTRLVAGALTLSVALAGCDHLPTNPGNGGADRIKHVFVIVLENKNYEDTFGTSTQDPYLQPRLRLSVEHEDDRRPDDRGTSQVARLHGRHGQRSGA
jgi:hypothetical protein